MDWIWQSRFFKCTGWIAIAVRSTARRCRAQVSAFFARARWRGRDGSLWLGPPLGSSAAELGHEVKLIAAQFVRPFVKTNKTDAADAQAIWEAAQRPEMRFVALKSEEQQAVLSLHRLRAQWVKIRTMQANQIRGLLYEFGVVVPLGWRALLKAGPTVGEPTAVRCRVVARRTARAARGIAHCDGAHRRAREATRELATCRA